MTKTAALENDETGVRVNAVRPGFIATPLLEDSMPEGSEARQQIPPSLPQNARHEPPTTAAQPPRDGAVEELREVIPASPRKGYDIDDHRWVVDEESLFELKPTYARNIVTTFARMDGVPTSSDERWAVLRSVEE